MLPWTRQYTCLASVVVYQRKPNAFLNLIAYFAFNCGTDIICCQMSTWTCFVVIPNPFARGHLKKPLWCPLSTKSFTRRDSKACPNFHRRGNWRTDWTTDITLTAVDMPTVSSRTQSRCPRLAREILDASLWFSLVV